MIARKLVLSIFLSILSVSLLTSCGGKKTTRAGAMPPPVEERTTRATSPLESSQKPQEKLELEDIRFGYDSHRLSPHALSLLKEHAKTLSERPGATVQIEGHCDERGTLEYNLALGERRAVAVRDYLVSYGVSSDRLSTISYGKERPVDSGHNEKAWARNRRAAFVIHPVIGAERRARSF